MRDQGFVSCAVIEEQESTDDKKQEPEWIGGQDYLRQTRNELLNLEPKLRSGRLNLRLLLCLGVVPNGFCAWILLDFDLLFGIIILTQMRW